MNKAEFEKEILNYALKEENHEDFAKLLNKILPLYTSWTWGQDGVYRRHFNDWQRSGFILMPNHYYSPIPDVSQMEATNEKKTEMIGVDMRENAQLYFLDNVCAPYKEEYLRFSDKKTKLYHEFHFNNGVFERVDAEVLHCMIRYKKPKRMIEIGSGYSTLISAAACEMNKKKDGVICDFTAIEPFPNELFKNSLPGLSRLIRKPLQDMDMNLFKTLKEGDILFIDSSHVLKTGSDVQLICLEIIPRLAPGVIIHIHDIFLPAEYPEKWIKEEHVFWNEQYFLQAFLSFNDSFEIVWAGSFMHHKYPKKLSKYFPGYSSKNCLPGSFWMKRSQRSKISLLRRLFKIKRSLFQSEKT